MLEALGRRRPVRRRARSRSSPTTSQGNVYAWDADGQLVFHADRQPALLGRAAAPFDTRRASGRRRERTEGGFVTSPVLADLDGDGDGARHHRRRRGPPRVRLARRRRRRSAASRCSSRTPTRSRRSTRTTNQSRSTNVDAEPGQRRRPGQDRRHAGGGATSTAPASRRDHRRHQRGVPGNTGRRGRHSTPAASTRLAGVLGQRACSTSPTGASTRSRRDRRSARPAVNCGSRSSLPGWPVKIGIIDAGLLPDVGEGINGAPVVAPLHCPTGGAGLKIGVTPDAGPGYVLNARRQLLLRLSPAAHDNALADRRRRRRGQADTPAFPAVGEPGLRHARRRRTIDMFAPARGPAARARRGRARLPEGRPGLHRRAGTRRPASSRPASRRQTTTSRSSRARPSATSTGEAPAQEVVAGTASQDLQALQRRAARRRAGVAEADRRLARRDAGARLARHDRHGARRQEGRRLDHALGHAVGLLDAGRGLLAELVAELPPRHRQLGRLHARRGRAGQSRCRRGLAGRADVRRAGRRPAVRHRADHSSCGSATAPGRARRSHRQRPGRVRRWRCR